MVFVPPSVLQLYGMGVPPYSCRGASQSLAPIQQAGNVVRAIAGNLMDLSYPPFQKYKSTITCSDQQPPAISGVWPGKLLTVYCIAEIVRDEYNPIERPAVPGSERTDGGFEMYRPILIMRVMNWSMDQEEWTAGVSWTLDLEEE